MTCLELFKRVTLGSVKGLNSKIEDDAAPIGMGSIYRDGRGLNGLHGRCG